MAIGINDLDYDEDDDLTTTQQQDTEEPQEDSSSYLEPEEPQDDRGILSEYLKSKGIEDISKIKYEGDDGNYEEVDWDTLDSSEKLSILNNLDSTNDTGLDDSEIQLINSIRSSRMSPAEYLNYVAQRGADQYAQNLAGAELTYEIDQYSDEELFATDLITRMGKDNITDEEVQEALDKAKSNESLFKKQVAALRNEYKNIEDLNRQYALYMQEQEKQEQFNQFANAIRDLIIDFKEFHGFELDMDNEDKEELYDFITGFDEAGTSILGKAMNDPATLVKMAWFALHGEEMLDDISEYVKSQVSTIRKTSYNQGVSDARAGKVKDNNKKPVTAFRPKTNTNSNHLSIDDLD